MTVSGGVSLFSQTTQRCARDPGEGDSPLLRLSTKAMRRGFRLASFLPTNSPFAIEGKKAERSVRVLSEEEMSREDRDLLANAQSSIQERAGIENLEFNGAGWTLSPTGMPGVAESYFHSFYAG